MPTCGLPLRRADAAVSAGAATALLLVPSSRDADDVLDALSLEIAEEPARACDRANSAAREGSCRLLFALPRRSRQSQSPQRRDREPGALLLLERGASHRAPVVVQGGARTFTSAMSDRQFGEPARSLLGPARPAEARGCTSRSAPFVRLERMLARAERGFDRGFSTYAGRGVSRMPLERRGYQLASRNLRESRMGLWPVIGSLSWLGAIPAPGR